MNAIINNPILSVLAFLTVSLGLAAIFLLVRDLVRPARRAGDADDLAPLALRGEPGEGLAAQIRYAFARLVVETGLDLRPFSGIALMLFCGLLTGGCLAAFYHDITFGLPGFFLGMALPVPLFSYYRGKRLRLMQEQLPGALGLLVRAVRAGESLDQALALAGDEVAHPLGLEFRRCARHLSVGLGVPMAARSLWRRVPLSDVRILATTLSVHRTTGGNLAITLERLADVIRDRLRSRRQFRVASASGRMAAFLMVSLAGLAFLAMLTWQPDYLNPLFETELGHMLLIAIVALQAVGLLWIGVLLRRHD